MRVFRRGIFSLLWSLLLAVVGGPFLGFIISWFTEDMYIILIPAILVSLWLLYSAIFSENIRFEIDEDGMFRYIKRKKIEKELNLKEYYCGYRTKVSDGTTDDLRLNLLKTDDSEDKFDIDCTPLGTSKFHKMFFLIEGYCAKSSNKLEVKKKLNVKNKKGDE